MKEYSNILKELNIKLTNENLINTKEKRNKKSFLQNNKTIKKTLNIPNNLNKIQINELNSLIINMKKHNFKLSSQLTNYLENNNLQSFYPNIVGQVKMNNQNGDFYFEGGLDPDIYYYVCEKLELKNNNSGSKVKEFIPYKYIKE